MASTEPGSAASGAMLFCAIAIGSSASIRIRYRAMRVSAPKRFSWRVSGWSEFTRARHGHDKEQKREAGGGLPQYSRRLEVELCRHLDDARIAGLRDLSEGPAEAPGVGVQELRMVEGVEELRAELERLVLADLEVLVDGDVEVVDPWPAQHVASHVAESEHGHVSAIQVHGI